MLGGRGLRRDLQDQCSLPSLPGYAGVTGVSVYQEAARHFILRSIASPSRAAGAEHTRKTRGLIINLLRVGAMFSIKVQGLINNPASRVYDTIRCSCEDFD